MFKNFQFELDEEVAKKVKNVLKEIQGLLEFCLLKILIFIFSILNIKVSYFIAYIIGNFVYFFLPLRKQVGFYNLKRVFKDKTDKELYSILRKVYINFSYFMLESMIMYKLRKDPLYGLKDNIKIFGLENLDEAIKKDKGSVLYTAHIGNWHIMGQKFVQLGYAINNVIKKQRNSFVFDEEVKGMLDSGMKITILQKTPKNIFKALINKDIVEFLADQDAGENGIFVDFFGLKASTATGPALFSLKMEVPLIFAIDLRENLYKHKIFIEKVDYIPTGEKDKDVYNLTEILNQKLEKYIYNNPEQYFWLHRRWFTRPFKKN
jgi:Kdo2-lipid IVA lauroyltransferase/acyltransferase